MKLGEQMLAVALIDDRESIQSRAEVSPEVVGEYSQSIQAGKRIPPIEVYFDGKIYRIADGIHRYSAVVSHNGTEILANVHEGGRLEALIHAVGANAHHGLRRTNKDKAHAVGLLLAEPVCQAWSDRKISEACGVSHTLVAAIRRPSDDAPRGIRCHASSTGSEVDSLPGRQQNASVAIPAPAAPPAPADPNAFANRLAVEAEMALTNARALVDAAWAHPRARLLLTTALEDTARWCSRRQRDSAA